MKVDNNNQSLNTFLGTIQNNLPEIFSGVYRDQFPEIRWTAVTVIIQWVHRLSSIYLMCVCVCVCTCSVKQIKSLF